jgi:fatty-acid desaturase
MFFVTAGYHRYFSHRSYKTSRVFSLLPDACYKTKWRLRVQ